MSSPWDQVNRLDSRLCLLYVTHVNESKGLLLLQGQSHTLQSNPAFAHLLLIIVTVIVFYLFFMRCEAFQLTNDNPVCCSLVCLFYFCHKTTKIVLKNIYISLNLFNYKVLFTKRHKVFYSGIKKKEEDVKD